MNSELSYARHFSELIVWQKARRLALGVFEVSKTFPAEEKLALTDQIRRSSRSIGAQIAEAWGKRRYEKHFINKLTDADAEQYETQHWLIIAYDAGHLSREQAHELGTSCREIGAMLGKMIASSAEFCGELENSGSYRVRENAIANEFFAPSSAEDVM